MDYLTVVGLDQEPTTRKILPTQERSTDLLLIRQSILTAIKCKFEPAFALWSNYYTIQYIGNLVQCG